MASPAEHFAAYEDLCQVWDRQLAQIIHGQLIVLTRPGPKHARASSFLGGSMSPKMDTGAPAAGGSCSNRNSIGAVTFGCPIWLGGDQRGQAPTTGAFGWVRGSCRRLPHR